MLFFNSNYDKTFCRAKNTQDDLPLLRQGAQSIFPTAVVDDNTKNCSR